MKAEDKSFYFLATPSYYDIPFFKGRMYGTMITGVSC